MQELISQYKIKKQEIQNKLNEFKQLSENSYFQELIFCLLTPQSQAQKCWQAAQEISKLQKNQFNQANITNILKTKTRFHNNKTKYILEASDNWQTIKKQLSNPNRQELRNFLAENIKGLGYKEASHFLRNIGKSDNQLAILDRHILRNLSNHNVQIPKTLTKSNYLKLESQFLELANQLNIPADHLDLLFWSQETSFIFK